MQDDQRAVIGFVWLKNNIVCVCVCVCGWVCCARRQSGVACMFCLVVLCVCVFAHVGVFAVCLVKQNELRSCPPFSFFKQRHTHALLVGRWAAPGGARAGLLHLTVPTCRPRPVAATALLFVCCVCMCERERGNTVFFLCVFVTCEKETRWLTPTLGQDTRL